MAGLRLQGVAKTYERVTAVAEATFDVTDGELLVLVGPSGCGKSTLLRMIAGLESISAGDLYIGERRVNDLAPRDRDIAMVFQSYALYPHMSVYDNLAFGLRLRHADRSMVDARVRSAAMMLELEPLLARRPSQLSGGQRQRVALGRALVRNPQVFLLDEPLSNLDAKLRLSMRSEIARLHRRLGTTMLYVTHDQIEAMTLGHRIVVMDGGRIQQIDTPMRVYDQPANLFVAGFLGSPAMNFFRGRLEAAPRWQLRCGEEALPLPAPRAADPAAELVVGLRPEDLVLQPLAGGFGFTAPVETIEPVGNEVFVTVRFGGEGRICRLPPRSLPEAGAPLTLYFDPDRLRYFDPATGRRLE